MILIMLLLIFTMVRRLTIIMPANIILAYKNSLLSKDICSKSLHLPQAANVRVTAACVERILEKGVSKISTPMNRLTNLFNLMVGVNNPPCRNTCAECELVHSTAHTKLFEATSY